MFSPAQETSEQTPSFRALRRDSGDYFLSMVRYLVSAIDAKDHYTRGHSKRTSKLVARIAMEMGLGPSEVQNIRLAGLLHDIGKIEIPESILLYDGKLTDAQYDILKKHVTYGLNIINGCRQLIEIVPVVRHHHERYDGRGYPDGLKGDAIPLGARIITVADSYDAMRSKRPFKCPMDKQSCVQELQRCSGTQFDPNVIHAFLRLPGERKIPENGK